MAGPNPTRGNVLILGVLPPAVLLYLPSLCVDRAIRHLAQREWQRHRHRPGGAEMMVVFERVCPVVRPG